MAEAVEAPQGREEGLVRIVADLQQPPQLRYMGRQIEHLQVVPFTNSCSIGVWQSCNLHTACLGP